MAERVWTQEDAKADALARNPDCAYGEVRNGLTGFLRLTWVVELWRDESCYLADDPPRKVEQGYLADTAGNRETLGLQPTQEQLEIRAIIRNHDAAQSAGQQ